NSVAGLKMDIPKGVYQIKEQIEFGPLLNVHFDFGGSEIYYDGGTPVPGEGALVFDQLSWAWISGIYSFAGFEFKSSYRVALSECKFQAGTNYIRDVWNFKATNCWWYYASLEIEGGNQQNFDNCAFEFTGKPSIKARNVSAMSFTNCYTEWQQQFMELTVDSTHDRFKGLSFRDCFFDVQMKGSVNTDGSPYFRFINTRGRPTDAPIIFDGCSFHSVALPPGTTAQAAIIDADDTFTNIVLRNCTYVQAGQDIPLGQLYAEQTTLFTRLFRGAGIRVEGWAPVESSPGIFNGCLRYP